MIKRDKGNFHRDDAPLVKKLEEELDHIVKSVNRYLEKKDKESSDLQKQIDELRKRGTGSGGSSDTLNSMVSYNERMFYGRDNINVIKDFDFNETSKVIADLRVGDLVELISIITKTIDVGITDFKINDGTNDWVVLDDIDFSVTSVATPPKASWIEIETNKTLTMTLTGAITLKGKIVVKILRKPMLMQ